MKRHVLAALTLALAAAPVHAVTLRTAQRVTAQFAQLQRPTRAAPDFAHWAYNTALLTAQQCWHAATGGDAIPAVLQQNPTAAGTFTLPGKDQENRLCQSVADHGIHPVCTHSTVWVRSAKRLPGLPFGYLPVPRQGPLQVDGVLHCYLNADQVQEQTFVTPLTAEWVVPPRRQSFLLAHGPRQLQAGTVLIHAQTARGLTGQPYVEPRTAVVGD